MKSRDFLGEETYLAWLKDYEDIRQQLNTIADKKGKPTEEDILRVRLLKPWDKFYKTVLNFK
jgi:hypothetical protein